LASAAQTLLDWIKDAQDEETQNVDVQTAKDFSLDVKNKRLIRKLISMYYAYTNSDDFIDKTTIPKPNPSETLQYYLLDVLRRELASSTVRRIKRNSTVALAKLTKEMGDELANTDIDKVVSDKEGPKLKAYKEKILEKYQKDIKKQEEMASGVTFEVAYAIAKGAIDADDPVIEKYLLDSNRQWKLIISVHEKIKSNQDVVKDASASLERRRGKILALKKDIEKDTYRMGVTLNSFKAKLLKKRENLKDANYKKNLLESAQNFSGKKNDLIKKETEAAIIAIKPKAGEEVLANFKATKLTINKKNNNESRRKSKTDITKQTLDVLSGKTTTIDTLDAEGKKVQQTSADLIKKAKETAIKESLEGPIHSRFRYIGSVVEPLVVQDGDKAKLEFILKVPVGDPSGGAYVGFRLTGQVEHEIEYDEEKTVRPGETFLRRTKDENGNDKLKANTFKVKAELAFVGGWRVPFVVDVGGEIGGYLEVETDNVRNANSGAKTIGANATGGLGRAMELISFGYYKRARESTVFPNLFINALWGLGGENDEVRGEQARAWGDAFRESFSDKDTVETGGFGAATASASMTDLATFKGGLKGYRGKRYTKQTMNALEKNKKGKQQTLGTRRDRNIGRNMNGTELAFEFGVGPFATGGKVKLSWLDNQAGGQLDEDLDEKIARLKNALLGKGGLDPNNDKQNKVREALSDKKRYAEITPAVITAVGDPKTNPTAALIQEFVDSLADRRLLKRQFFSLETELSAASKGGNLGNPSQIAAEALKWSGEAGAKVRTSIMSLSDQYGKNNKGKNVGSSFFSTALIAIDEGVNGALNYNPQKISDKLESAQKLTNTQMNSSLHTAATNQTALDKLSTFAVKSSSGLKLTLKHSTKRDFASSQEGSNFSKNYPTKFEIIFDQVVGGSLGSQIAVVSAEKATRLLRFGIKYKDGNKSLMTM
jgi:hypothetical protein